MKKLTIKFEEIKNIKQMMDEVDRLKEKNLTFINDYSYNYNGKEDLIDYKEKMIEKNITNVSKILNVEYICVVDMCYDFDFAKEILANKQ